MFYKTFLSNIFEMILNWFFLPMFSIIADWKQPPLSDTWYIYAKYCEFR